MSEENETRAMLNYRDCDLIELIVLHNYLQLHRDKGKWNSFPSIKDPAPLYPLQRIVMMHDRMLILHMGCFARLSASDRYSYTFASQTEV